MPKQKRESSSSASLDSLPPTYTHYRNATIGTSLNDAMDDLIQKNMMTEELKSSVMAQFDKSISDVLRNRVKTKASFKGNCDTFRFVDNVYMFELKNATFTIENDQVTCTQGVKILACDSKPNVVTKGKGKNKK